MRVLFNGTASRELSNAAGMAPFRARTRNRRPAGIRCKFGREATKLSRRDAESNEVPVGRQVSLEQNYETSMPLYWSIRYCGARNGKQTMLFGPGTFHDPSDTYSVDKISRSAKAAGSRKSQARRTATSRELSNGVSFSAIGPPTLLTRSSQNAIDQ